MKEETKRMVRAYIEVYDEFVDVYRDFYDLKEEPLAGEYFIELAKLFEIVWNNSFLGEVLKEEVLKRYQEIMQAEQVKKKIEEEAESGAMII